MFAVMGLANTVYHPADYSLLSEHVAPERATQVFSFHTFSGMVGSAVAPMTLLFLQSLVGWRGAFLGATALGLVAALILILQKRAAGAAPGPSAKPHGREGRRRSRRRLAALAVARRSCSISCSSSCCRWSAEA